MLASYSENIHNVTISYHLHYYHPVLPGLLQLSPNPPPCFQAPRMILLKHENDHVTSLLKILHSLPISLRVKAKAWQWPRCSYIIRIPLTFWSHLHYSVPFSLLFSQANLLVVSQTCQVWDRLVTITEAFSPQLNFILLHIFLLFVQMCSFEWN